MESDRKQVTSRQIREQAADWVIRLGDGDLDPQEQQSFDAWLAADEAHRRAFERASQVLGDARIALVRDPGLTRRLVRKRRGPSTGIIALVLTLAGTGLFMAADGPLWLKADAISATNERSVVDLPDGSRIFLNANSAISEDFTGALRKVVLLRGEAYFEVARNPARPFVIDAGAGQVRVLGTAFNINLTGGEAEVTVSESSVSVTGSSSAESAVLTPGMRISYDDHGRLGKIETVPEGFEAPWRSGRLVFEERPISKVVEEISRYLPGKVVVMKNSVGNRRISGSFDLNDPQEAMASFAHTFGLKIIRAGPLMTMIY